eukprot:NODE_725_length_4426_cov_0.934597.p6 type:complete len:138 gc:universal NODE_725_length_4426_cov_0.934597:449-862(+)
MSMIWDPSIYSNHEVFYDQGGRILELLDPKRHECILDIGCGSAETTDKIAKVCNRIVGVDSSAEMIESANSRYKLDLRCIDATEIEFRDEFHAIFSNACFHWIQDHHLLAQKMYSALKSGGRLVVEFGGQRQYQDHS